MEESRELELQIAVPDEIIDDGPDYEPVEGIDYIVDLYSISGVTMEATPDEIKTEINNRLLEYHPDRLQGLAPEFIRTGELTARLLNRAKTILLNPENRQAYDELLSSWEGPVSDKGIPAIHIDRYVQTKALLKSPEELEASIKAGTEKAALLMGYRPDRAATMEALVGSVTDEGARSVLLQELNDALEKEDLLLSVEELQRLDLLGIDSSKRGYSVGAGYADKVVAELEASKADQEAAIQLRNSSNVTERLALLAGEALETHSELVATARSLDDQFIDRFQEQSQRVVDIAKAREDLLARRLSYFEPDFPFADLQAELKPAFFIGVAISDKFTWLGFTYEYDTEANEVNPKSFDFDDETGDLLENGKYDDIIARGYNLFTFQLLNNIEIMTLINVAIGKYLKRYGINT